MPSIYLNVVIFMYWIDAVEDLGKWDVIVVGGGLVGMAAALGMSREKASTLVFDAGDHGTRASRGNFGLVWAQSKGANCREYAVWTREAVTQWPQLEEEIRELSGVETDYRHGNGLHVCVGDAEFAARADMVARISAHQLPYDDTRMIDRQEVAELLPGVGDRVTGGSISSLDGACQSLALYRGLTLSIQAAGVKLIPLSPVHSIEPHSSGYRVSTGHHTAWAKRVLVAAGLAINDLIRPLGLPDLVRPQRGQILVTERSQPILKQITSSIRQTSEGSILIGDTKEEAGEDDRSTSISMTQLARRTHDILPRLGSLRIVRSWAALRVLTQDGIPVYDESPDYPGVFVATTHSGVTLAPVHRHGLARWILGGAKPKELEAFQAKRFQT